MKTKIDVLKRIQKVELRQAKQHAAQQAENLLQTKLKQARDAYNIEYSKLFRQFESMQEEMKEQKDENMALRKRLIQLEFIISQQNNQIQSKGYSVADLAKSDCPAENDHDQKQLDALEKMYDDETLPPKVKVVIDEKHDLLKQPFNFYTFSVDINSENRVDTMNRIYNRLLEK